MDQLSGDIDTYVADPAIAESDKCDLDETDLRRRGSNALHQLRELDAKPDDE